RGGGKRSPPSNEGDKIGAREKVCFSRGIFSKPRRYGISCDQETENDGPSGRRTRSDVRPPPRPARQPIQSCGHWRWYPRLQSNAPALLMKKRFAKGLPRCSQPRARVANGTSIASSKELH